MIYAFLDTNICIRIMSQGKPGCELNHFHSLKTLVEGNVFRLLVPEIVLLELEKEHRVNTKEYDNEFGKLKKGLSLATSWSEMEDVKEYLQTIIQNKKEDKIKDSKKHYFEILEFLESKDVEFIPFTVDILLRGKRRLMAGRMPKHGNNSDQDAFIIESLISYFEKCNDEKKQLMFCSENHKHFALECKSRQKDRIFNLHPIIQSDFPQSLYTIDLERMLDFTKGYESLPEPSNSKITKARQKLEELEIIEGFDFESDDYSEHFSNLVTLINEESAKQFNDEFLAKLSPEMQQKRASLLDNANQLLADCRSCKSWDDKSEYKLPQWLENVSEEMICYTSLSNLIRIKDNLQRYFKIHEEEDSQQEK